MTSLLNTLLNTLPQSKSQFRQVQADWQAEDKLLIQRYKQANHHGIGDMHQISRIRQELQDAYDAYEERLGFSGYDNLPE